MLKMIAGDQPIPNVSTAESQPLATREPLMLFDGVCGLCSAWVDFVIRFDRRGTIFFAPLQAPAAQQILKAFGLPADYLEGILFLSNGKLFKNSEAVLQIFRHLPFPFSLAFAFIVVPTTVRDAVYRYVAAHRYRWFGKMEACRLPSPEERARFI